MMQIKQDMCDRKDRGDIWETSGRLFDYFACSSFWRRGRLLPIDWDASMASTFILSFSAQGGGFKHI